jgi:hypothetical protein
MLHRREGQLVAPATRNPWKGDMGGAVWAGDDRTLSSISDIVEDDNRVEKKKKRE